MPEEAQPPYSLYASWRDSADLEQGDLLQPDDGLRAAIEDVHPHFVDPKYTAFIVLTQTCDLVRRVERGRVCKAPYVNLAVV